MQTGTSALPSKADVCGALAYVRFMPIASHATLEMKEAANLGGLASLKVISLRSARP
jgi:hypothetical protein